MKVKLGQAVKMFFGNSSLEMVFIEAVSNALDAEANKICINIQAEALSSPDTLCISITDNGLGFDDTRYGKFCNLFDVDESSHKGLGRLVYLCYFEEVFVDSLFSSNQRREFKFSPHFEAQDFKLSEVSQGSNSTKLFMTKYTLQKIAKAEYLQAKYLKNRLLEEFFPRFFMLKQQGVFFDIKISAQIGDSVSEEYISPVDIPFFHLKAIELPTTLFGQSQLYYSIEPVEQESPALISAISVDQRTFKVDLIAEDYIPSGYKMVFLLFSDFFTGKVDASRQNLTLSKNDLKEIQHFFRRQVAALIEQHIPKTKEKNDKIKSKLLNTYPHLNGYFDLENIGYIKRNEILKNAQDEFFKAQKELLEASHLSDEQFEKSLDISARALTEYILFRQLTINKLKESTTVDSEADLHQLIASKGREGRFEKSQLVNDIYKNNAWILDDKFMTYEVGLSDREMSELIALLVDDSTEDADKDRPDLALIFSNNPKGSKPFDVVIVELKKRGLNQYDNIKTVLQLESRARKLMSYYDNKVQRIWYYGIIEFNHNTELSLRSQDFKSLYSSGKLYYKNSSIAISINPDTFVPADVFIWDIDAIIEDANARNHTFLEFIKSKFTN